MATTRKLGKHPRKYLTRKTPEEIRAQLPQKRDSFMSTPLLENTFSRNDQTDHGNPSWKAGSRSPLPTTNTLSDGARLGYS
ncbi:hypothetical protein ACQU0X_12095 [Pseudovibrio ascidiaceicola]|uniref:hypothetical protein n=1 Tax=Pseudovibrio ascidiaceicola TaxID=285279 RepID=UPI003D369AA3